MKRFFLKYYKSRLVHINVNAIISAFLSLIISANFVYLTRYITDNHFYIAILSYVIDGVVDFIIFAGLHATLHVHHFKHAFLTKVLARDIGILQVHRVIFSVITLVVGAGTQILLMNNGLDRTLSFLIAYTIGNIATRCAHTFYGMRTGLFKPLHLRKEVKKFFLRRKRKASRRI